MVLILNCILLFCPTGWLPNSYNLFFCCFNQNFWSSKKKKLFLFCRTLGPILTQLFVNTLVKLSIISEILFSSSHSWILISRSGWRKSVNFLMSSSRLHKVLTKHEIHRPCCHVHAGLQKYGAIFQVNISNSLKMATVTPKDFSCPPIWVTVVVPLHECTSPCSLLLWLSLPLGVIFPPTFLYFSL